ncbi:hypothetical protein K402DRAFT_395235 [Aulographum hederae CBS 113979]|uniref:Uncharacterized protein n=1 Tax=Aulographum hederae CBS 113979 TaxID=1176131 RepID=A0A6G1GV86_9PEZI|nr:hypothetical protein K402DRAFT_395235 [Aulographum hederae CBS 113979]
MSVSKNSSQQERSLAQQQLRNVQIEESEKKASASAQAGLNLNLFGAISGVFAGKSKKTTDTDANGKSHSVEDSQGVAHAKGAGGGTLNAIGSAKADSMERERKLEGESVDFLGIEERK